ncbi:hypothetical protein BKA70DRAFT_315306 [Coprinopsis sp. MPI-PUGE-AT-0042]|nr:hypothetical protein BKA70DRAFT_315306 [Coprinopsis sp. MPI-PUGE-AT-0042]
MAVPAELTILDISGKFVMNKELSETDKTDVILGHQGVGWLTRKALGYGTLTLVVKHTKDAAGVETINIDQTLTGGIPGASEQRILSWEDREVADPTYGAILTKARRVKPSELDVEWLKMNWTADTAEHGVVQIISKSDTAKSGYTWSADQTWGIEEVNGERRYARHVKFAGPKGEDIEARLVYDYLGPLDS